MKEFYLVERRDSFGGYDYSVMPHFKPSASLEVVRGRLLKLCSCSKKNRKILIFQSGILLSEITICNGRIVHENSCADKRNSSEIEADFFYEARSRAKRTVVSSWSLNRFLLSGHSEEDRNLQKKLRMRIKLQKRNTRKVPG